MTATAQEREEPRTELKRVMGPRLLLLFIVGDIPFILLFDIANVGRCITVVVNFCHSFVKSN